MLLGVTIYALLDTYPSARNLARLELLNEPAYFVYRTMRLNGLVLLFGLLFLLAERFPLDHKTGMKLPLMSHALQKWQYIWGKLLGGFLYTFSILCIFLASNTAVYFAAAPFPVPLSACMVPLVKAILVSALPVSLFVSFCSAAHSFCRPFARCLGFIVPGNMWRHRPAVSCGCSFSWRAVCLQFREQRTFIRLSETTVNKIPFGYGIRALFQRLVCLCGESSI